MSRAFDRLPLQSRLRWAAAACLGAAWLATMLLWWVLGMPRMGTGAALLAVLLAGVWLALRHLERRALAPLAELAGEAASREAALLPVPPTADEVAVIARGFNALVERLHEAQRHEREHLDRLEEAVRQRTQALRVAVEEAQAASQAKSRFLASLSHEVRTPMNGVLGMAQLLSATALDATQRNYLDLMQRSASGLLGLLDELLDFSRLEGHAIELAAQPVALRSLLDEVAAAVYPLAVERGLLFEGHLSPDLPQRVQGDTSRLRQVCLNLLTNAVKFTQVGQVRLAVRRDEARGLVLIEVSDTGQGIPPEMRARIFTPFVQLDDSLARRQGGVGLGLSIVDTLVRAMGGHTEVDSEPGHGSTFRVCLPLAVLADAAPQPSRSLRVAVISDAPGGQQALRDRLLFLGHDCVAALTWRELSFAPEALSEAKPEAVLYDEPPSGWPAGGTGVFATERAPWISVLVHRSAPLPGLSGPRRVVRPLSDAALQRALDGPDALAMDAGALPEAAAAAPTRGPLLLVEDNEINQVVARSFLEHLGFEVDVSGDSDGAFGALRERDYALILMDCQMPGMDGYETTRRIRAGEVGERAQRTPIVALTAHASPDDRRRCLDAGMNDYLAKPVNVQSLAATLERWLLTERV
jgi:signal transduction histidine kinase/CheY-like chemotaxis protein